jgi:hypothetical protein
MSLGAFTVTVVEPVFVVSYSAVAVIVTCVSTVTDGAVKTPACVMVPTLADQFTELLYVPVPVTVAEQFVVEDGCTEFGLHEAVTELIDPLGAAGAAGVAFVLPLLPPPPQSTRKSTMLTTRANLIPRTIGPLY